MVIETGVAHKNLKHVCNLEEQLMKKSMPEALASDGKDPKWMRSLTPLSDDSTAIATSEMPGVTNSDALDDVDHNDEFQAPCWGRLVTGETEDDGLWMRGASEGKGALAALPCQTALNLVPPQPSSEWLSVTTVMMCNLSNKYTQLSFMEEINAAGFFGLFDFFYLPLDPETKVNRGYAFINFLEPSLAWKFKMRYEGAEMDHANSGKCITVMTAAIQGFDANYAHYAGSRVSRGDIEARPLFLRETPKVADDDAPPRRRRGGGRRSLIDMVHQRRSPDQQQVQQQAPQQLMLSAMADASKLGATGPVGNAPVPPHLYMQPLLMFPAATGFTPTPMHMASSQYPMKDASGQAVNFCPFCGARAGSGDKFCRSCGSQLTAY
jgi:hypothetical protein